MSRIRPLLLTSLVVLIVALPASAAVRLTTSVNGEILEVRWPDSAFPIRYQADQRLVDALGSQAPLDQAFNAWSSIPNTLVAFQSDGVAAGTKAGRDGRNVITVADDLFANQRVIAVTTNWDEKGTLVESDVQVDPSLIGGSYNIQMAITHEIGHLLGLDHSGVLSAVMYPYVPRGNDEVVIDSDDRIGITSIYAASRPNEGGVLRGRVSGDGGGIFAAHVVAMNDRGEPVATALTNASGEFTLDGVPDGTYRIYAEPLDGPVDTKNLSPYWRQAKVTSFPTQFHSGEPVQVVAGNFYGNLVVNASGVVDLNPRWLGVSSRGSSDFKLTSSAVSVRAGQTISLAVAGDGMISGMTTFDVLSPGIQRISDFRYAGNYVYADFQIAGDTPNASAIILVTRGNETAALTGALRIQSASSGRRRVARK